MNPKHTEFTGRVQSALQNSILRKALTGLQERLGKGTAGFYQSLPEGSGLRLQAHDIRMHGLEHLDILLERLADTIQENGGHVFFARDGAEAVDYALGVAAKHNVQRVVKGKSMVTEEIGLNRRLEAAGIEVTETDLGEYIVQLAGETPSHIVAPAAHKTREQVGRLFSEKLGIAYTDDPPSLTRAARKALREKFLAADMGITGCNLACAETGHITTVSNEGNIRLSSTLPRVHLVFMGMERIVARLADHAILFRLLSGATAAQRMAGYVSYVGGPARPEFLDGPEAFHLVILDNGRSRILADERFREMLCCIRCGACLNVCPVYGKIGGHAYAFPYAGPVGAVVGSLLFGVANHPDLCRCSTLCRACQNACPVNIDIPRMLLELRAQLAEGDPGWDVTPQGPAEGLGYRLWSMVVDTPALYTFLLHWGARVQRWGEKIPGFPGGMPPFLAREWRRSREMPVLASRRFVNGRRGTNRGKDAAP